MMPDGGGSGSKGIPIRVGSPAVDQEDEYFGEYQPSSLAERPRRGRGFAEGSGSRSGDRKSNEDHYPAREVTTPPYRGMGIIDHGRSNSPIPKTAQSERK
jgi:hypothetical protein